MKKFFQKILSMLMAFVVLISTMSFTLNMHYCGETLVATSFFESVESCGMEIAKSKLPNGCSMEKPDCCKNEQSLIKGQDELKLNFDKISFDQHIFVAAFFHTYSALFESTEEIRPSLPAYPPPNIVRHIYKLDESYLI